MKPVRKKESVRMEAALPELGWGARGPQDCPESQAIHSHLDPSQGPPAWESGCRAAGRGLQQPQEEQKRAQCGERGVRASGDSGVAASSLLVTGRMTQLPGRARRGLPRGLSSQGRKRL